jgi:hypothetical protein
MSTAQSGTDTPSIWEQVKAEYACLCARRELRRQLASNGATAYRYQCQRCGKLSECIKKSHPAVLSLATFPPWVDTELRATYEKAMTDEAGRRYIATRPAEYAASQRERQEFYEAYLCSPEWRGRRKQVLERDAYLCQACRISRATQVHHLTYKHLGNEPLFDLVAVCVPCHERITELDRANRGV